MSAPFVIVERLRHAGIDEAAIIDDVFDGPAFIDIQHRLDSFREEVEDDPIAFEELRGKYGVNSMADVSIDIARLLYRDLNILGIPLRTYVATLLSDYLIRLEMVNRVKSHLRELGIRVTCYGKIDDVDRLPPDSVRLVLLDYSLSPDAEEPSAASEWCAEQLSKRKERRPFLVLISDRPDAEAHKRSFREKTNQLGGTFAFIRKQEAQESGVLYLHIAAWGLGHPAHVHIQAFVEAVIDSMDETVGRFRATLRGLTVQDYSFIQRIGLKDDGHPLGDYILEVLTGLLSHQFRGNREIQAPRRAVDGLYFDHHLASMTQPSTELAFMYRLAVTDPVSGDIGPHPHVVRDGISNVSQNAVATRAYHIWESEGRPPYRDREHWDKAEREAQVAEVLSSLPLLALGDIFTKGAYDFIWMVVNAACDLLFSPRSGGRDARPEQPIYLIQGVLADLRTSGDVGGKEVTELFQFEGKPYRILWDVRYVRSVPLREFMSEMTRTGYQRTARLALPYALKIQREWTAHLDRVGLPSPPPTFDEADVSVYALDRTDQWVRLAGPIRGGAVLVRRKVKERYEELCVLTTEGEAVVYSQIDNVIRHGEEYIAELRLQARPHWDVKAQKRAQICEQLRRLREDLSWRLNLLEVPRTISSTDPAWIVRNVVALYFEAGRQRNFDKHAVLVVDVTRPSGPNEAEAAQ